MRRISTYADNIAFSPLMADERLQVSSEFLMTVSFGEGNLVANKTTQLFGFLTLSMTLSKSCTGM